MMRRKVYAIWFYLLWFAMYGGSLKANMVYPLEIFTSEGLYYDDPNLDMYVEVSSLEPGRVGFTFYNEGSVGSSIARIYFEDGLLSGIVDINEGPGTLFSRQATPHNLPAGNTLEPSFVAMDDFCVDADPSPAKNGINPGEWVQITFDLKSSGTIEAVIDELNAGTTRIGAHVIALPDGSSGSAITVPEPATIFLLGTAGLWIFAREKRSV